MIALYVSIPQFCDKLLIVKLTQKLGYLSAFGLTNGQLQV